MNGNSGSNTYGTIGLPVQHGPPTGPMQRHSGPPQGPVNPGVYNQRSTMAPTGLPNEQENGYTKQLPMHPSGGMPGGPPVMQNQISGPPIPPTSLPSNQMPNSVTSPMGGSINQNQNSNIPPQRQYNPQQMYSPPMNQAPMTQPPLSHSPLSQQPANHLPMGQPPLNQTPLGQPPMHQPPMGQPTLSQTAPNHPPLNQPPMNQPPMKQPPMGQPPQMNQSPLNQPPFRQPPLTQQSMNQQQPPLNQPPMMNNYSMGGAPPTSYQQTGYQQNQNVYNAQRDASYNPGGVPPLAGPGYQSGIQSHQPKRFDSDPMSMTSPNAYNPPRNVYPGQMPGGGPSPGYQPGMQPPAQGARRLDPEQMPSPIQVIEDDQRLKGGVFVTNQNGLVPPLVTTDFITQDQGNASPRYVRSTMYTVPTSADIIKQTNVPFGLILSPMAKIEEGEYEPPVIDMGEIGPVRCVRCKAYMCPFMQFIDAGRRFQCMFCKATSEVPPEYFQHLDHTGQRMDRYERPELMLGSYEYIATKDYCRDNKFPKPPAIIFLIDVSYNNVKSGLVNLVCSKMKEIISNLPVDYGQAKSNMKVGFITYSNTVQFYNINPRLAQPQMMVVGDVQDVFMPLLDGFLCSPEESEAVIDSLMLQIPQMFADSRETETILAPAIQAGLEALTASECSGKLIVFHSSLPIAEAPGKLKNRDDRKLLGTDKEKTILAPQNNVYNNLGQECVAKGCSVDLFVFNNSYIDIATISQVSRLTGGEVYKYTYFQVENDGDRLIRDVICNVSRPIAFDAVMRVRTSTGVRATDFFGHFYMSNTTDLELASIDCDKAIAIEVKHDDKLTEEEGVYIQAALLYTACSGVRRLRIINLSLKTSSQMAELYRACDLDAIVNFFSKQSVFKLIDSSPKSIKDGLVVRCANILASYRKHCASPSSAGQLILPECMKLLPLYVNCIMKSDSIAGGADMTVDDRSFVMQCVSIMPVPISVTYFYPRLLSLADVDPQGSEMPQMLRCSIDKFTDDGAFLLENTVHMFLWLGLGLSSHWAQEVFGVQSVVQIDVETTALPVLDTPLNKRIRDIVEKVRAQRHRCMRLTIVRQRDKLEMVLRHFLVEDRGNDGSPSYVDFLCHMHKEIRNILSQ